MKAGFTNNFNWSWNTNSRQTTLVKCPLLKPGEFRLTFNCCRREWLAIVKDTSQIISANEGIHIREYFRSQERISEEIWGTPWTTEIRRYQNVNPGLNVEYLNSREKNDEIWWSRKLLWFRERFIDYSLNRRELRSSGRRQFREQGRRSFREMM
jgi:hypothetical protein